MSQDITDSILTSAREKGHEAFFSKMDELFKAGKLQKLSAEEIAATKAAMPDKGDPVLTVSMRKAVDNIEESKHDSAFEGRPNTPAFDQAFNTSYKTFLNGAKHNIEYHLANPSPEDAQAVAEAPKVAAAVSPETPRAAISSARPAVATAALAGGVAGAVSAPQKSVLQAEMDRQRDFLDKNDWQHFSPEQVKAWNAGAKDFMAKAEGAQSRALNEPAPLNTARFTTPLTNLPKVAQKQEVPKSINGIPVFNPWPEDRVAANPQNNSRDTTSQQPASDSGTQVVSGGIEDKGLIQPDWSHATTSIDNNNRKVAANAKDELHPGLNEVRDRLAQSQASFQQNSATAPSRPEVNAKGADTSRTV